MKTTLLAGPAPRVTIALPTYRRAESLLEPALRSALAQSWDDLELIVADNASPDGTRALVGSYPDPRLRYFRHRTNIGWSANFAFCLERARGEYFLLYHDDDLIDPDFLRTCLDAVDRSGLDHASAVRTGVRVIDAHDRTLYEAPNLSRAMDLASLVDDWCAGRFSPYLCNTLFHTATLRSTGGFAPPDDHWQDVHAQFRTAARAPWVHVEGIKASFRQHDGELTNSTSLGPWIAQAVGLADELQRLLPKAPATAARARRFLWELTCKRCRGVRPLSRRVRELALVADGFGLPGAHWRWLAREARRRLRLSGTSATGERR